MDLAELRRDRDVGLLGADRLLFDAEGAARDEARRDPSPDGPPTGPPTGPLVTPSTTPMVGASAVAAWGATLITVATPTTPTTRIAVTRSWPIR